MECSARIERWHKFLLCILFTLCYEGLFAQEIDLLDYRYYRRFETIEELMEEEERDSLVIARVTIDRDFSTRMLDYNLSAIRFARRGINTFERTTTLNGTHIPYIGGSTARTLQLRAEHHYGANSNGLTGELQLRIDTIRQQTSRIGVRFLSRNMPYSISASTAHRLGQGWSLSANMLFRTGRDIFVEGLFGTAARFNAVVTKEFNTRNRVAFALFIEPSMRGSRLSATAEAFRLTGNNLYNPAWGYQDGKVRNSRIRREVAPTAVIAYEAALSEGTKMDISASVTAGVERYSSLDWFDAQTPAPDNYRYMPSYFADEEDKFLEVESAWLMNDTRYTQIDFDKLIATNRLHGGRATYTISDRVERIVNTNFNALFHTALERGTISYGLEITTRNSRNYKQMRDMLGAEYIVDLDYFLLDDDTYSNYLQNDMNSPSRHICHNDRYSYDYTLRQRTILLYGAYRYTTQQLRLDIAAKVGYAEISRKGHFRKELFADNSFGVSRYAKFAPYLVKASGEYLLGENHLFGATLLAEAHTCDAEDNFLQSKYNNRLIDSPSLCKGYGAEVRYIFKRQNLTLSTSLFATTTLDDRRVEHIYDDLSGEYSDFVISNIDILRYGLEIEAEYNFANNFRATAAVAMGRYEYIDNARITAYSDTSNTLLVDNALSHTRHLSLGNAPQIALTAALSYYNRGWWAVVNANYATLRYVEPSLVMRTERVLAMASSPEQRSQIVRQERLRDAFTLDISLSKSLYLDRFDKRIYRSKAAPRFTDKYPRARVIFRAAVRNLLGSRNMVYSGYESSRLQRHKLADEYLYNRQATRYTYAYPRTYEASISFCF